MVHLMCRLPLQICENHIVGFEYNFPGRACKIKSSVLGGCLKYLLSFDCFADGGFVCGFAIHLGAGRVEDDGRCPDRVELGVVLGLGVAEVLDLGHGELAHPDQPRSIREITYGILF